MIYRVLRTALFRIDAERAHRLAMGALGAVCRLPPARLLLRRICEPRDPRLAVEAFGISFASPLGLAAGFDKEGEWTEPLAALGFGFVEVGTATALAQPGNDRPRIVRLPRDRALVNRMGFPNSGATAIAARLASPRTTPVGANIGRSRAADDDGTIADYAASARALAPVSDFLVINVSSPNTPGLRDLQAAARLRSLIDAVRAETAAAARTPPLLVKISPDLTDAEIDAIADLALEAGLDGIIATNTTTARERLRSDAEEIELAGAGGLSGQPLADRSLTVLRRLRARVGDRVVLISVGGIETAGQAWQRIAAGATLVQAYTGFVYGGALWPARINRGLASLVTAGGWDSVAAAVGSAARTDGESIGN